ncbi:ABC-2 family transporter protein [Clostridium tepidiprofundi DSM 19306]|uniref:ABC-2 family transporter protein n=1 Tax=Clostridium tepidiprofundi DSM 19306 TaxID=1121338 RepID=A0A151B2V4_9CLOT|nr:lantibiotic immunity ABC transporter MutE/EpiE family permease subunit [Clostridium tepidiprofundi]KYH34269.1 ABC-2 family transporter protein [Clostridium tepidiprofundi DSM 19306]
MINMLQSENLKYKRTFSKKLFFIAPMYILIQIIAFSKYVFLNSMNWWSICFMPFTISIICTLSTRRERKSGNYRTLKSKYIDLRKMWISKILVIAYYTFLASLMLILYFLVVKLIYSTSFIPLDKLFFGTFVIWLTTLILIPICLFLSEAVGAFSSILVTCAGIVVAILMATKVGWYLCPWSLNIRLMCPILKLHPNGTQLNPGNFLLDSSVIPIGIIIGITGFAVLSILTSLWFAKKEDTTVV